jgi:hypothetical protein
MRTKAFTVVALGIVASIILAGCAGSGQVVGSRDQETREFDFRDFTRVEVAAIYKVVITRGDTFGVSVTANKNLFDHMEIAQSGDTLILRMKPFLSFRNVVAIANITVPELTGFKLGGASAGEVRDFQSLKAPEFTVSGASRLTLSNVKATDVRMDISGASRGNGELTAQEVVFRISGASTLEITGSADTAKLEASGASSLRMANFRARDADVNLSGASNGDLEVSGRIDIQLSGASRLTFGGNPTVGKIDVSGASTINRR